MLVLVEFHIFDAHSTRLHTTMLKDRKLLEGINKKKTSAWRALYRYLYGSLCNYAAEICKDIEAADDIVQECLISVWRSDLIFTSTRGLLTYLYKAVYHNSLKYIRDRHSDQGKLEEYRQDLPSEEDAIYQAVEEELINQLRTAIDQLPEQRKRILLLSMEGKTVADIAELLQISENTVKTQKKRAYAYIKQALGVQYALFLLLF